MRYTFLDYLRSRRFAILLGIMLLISAILTDRGRALQAGELPQLARSSFYSGWWGMSATFVIVLSGIFFGGDAISGEFQNKTGYFTLPNPIRRSSVYIGKWLSAFIASSIVLFIFTAITVANEAYYFGLNIPWQFGESFLFAWFYLVAVLGFTFFFSSLFKSTSYSILVTAILFLFAFTLIETLVAALAQIEPWFILTYGSEIIGNVLMPTYPRAHLQDRRRVRSWRRRRSHLHLLQRHHPGRPRDNRGLFHSHRRLRATPLRKERVQLKANRRQPLPWRT